MKEKTKEEIVVTIRNFDKELNEKFTAILKSKGISAQKMYIWILENSFKNPDKTINEYLKDQINE